LRDELSEHPMTKTIFISLPVADLAASTAFYKALGFEQNAIFSDDIRAPECLPANFRQSRRFCLMGQQEKDALVATWNVVLIAG
jgi:catechol 2,3-dioxygenase-like lactoylglutathione lyase family enzyme